jgi:serine beta-lactamase-like protein LACTB, mitochondrial
VTGWPRRAAAGMRVVLVGTLLTGTAGAAYAAQAPSPPAAATPGPSPSPSPAASPLASPSPAAPAASPSPPAITPGLANLPAGRVAAIETAILAGMARLGVPGLSAAVVRDRELRWSSGYGLADVENDLPATPVSVYRLASVSKPITATAVLQLVERGRLDLDVPIQRYVPSFPDKPWPITTRQLLGHQSGLRNWTEEEFHNTRRYTSIGDALAPFKDDPLLFEPGTSTQYTSLGFTLLGAVVEGAGGAPFMEQLRASVFQPAGMDSARDDDVFAIVPHRARGYQRRGDGSLANAPLTDTSNRVPGGGLVASVEDVARFAAALQRGALLRPETLQKALTAQKVRSGRRTGYGLGWVLGRRGARREAYHVGGQPQVSTVVYMLPDAGVAVAILADLEGVENGLLDVARQVAGIAAP